MIKIYYPSLDKDIPRGELFPLLKPFIKGESFTDKERIDLYGISDKDYSFVGDIKTSDLVILPLSWNHYSRTNTLNVAEDLILEAHEANKKVYSFMTGDFGVRISNYDNLVVLRMSGDRSQLPHNHIGMPVFIQDPIKKGYGDLNHFPEFNKPSIGFCGQSNHSLINTIQEIVKVLYRNFRFYIGKTKELPQVVMSTSSLRNRVLNVFKRSERIKDVFIEREKYRAGVKTQEDKQRTTEEFYSNIANNEYTVCVRGAGNFSVRFYETLAMGRIPIFVNTDCILPLVEQVNWRSHLIWAEKNQISDLPQKVVGFHSKFTEQDRNAFLQSNRKLWEDYLTMNGYFKNLFSEYAI